MCSMQVTNALHLLAKKNILKGQQQLKALFILKDSLMNRRFFLIR